MNDQSIKARRLAGKLCEDLQHFFQEKLAQEHRIEAERQPVKPPEAKEDQEAACSFIVTFYTPTGRQIQGHFLVTYSKGNVYSISVSIVEGEYKLFTIGLPIVFPQKGTGAYTHDLCVHVLKEVERMTDESFLRAVAKAPEG